MTLINLSLTQSRPHYAFYKKIMQDNEISKNKICKENRENKDDNIYKGYALKSETSKNVNIFLVFIFNFSWESVDTVPQNCINLPRTV